jgi:hypothetical protein
MPGASRCPWPLVPAPGLGSASWRRPWLAESRASKEVVRMLKQAGTAELLLALKSPAHLMRALCAVLCLNCPVQGE